MARADDNDPATKADVRRGDDKVDVVARQVAMLTTDVSSLTTDVSFLKENMATKEDFARHANAVLDEMRKLIGVMDDKVTAARDDTSRKLAELREDFDAHRADVRLHNS